MQLFIALCNWPPPVQSISNLITSCFFFAYNDITTIIRSNEHLGLVHRTNSGANRKLNLIHTFFYVKKDLTVHNVESDGACKSVVFNLIEWCTTRLLVILQRWKRFSLVCKQKHLVCGWNIAYWRSLSL